MLTKCVLGAIVVAGALTAAVPAQAVDVLVTYTGTVSSGYDQTGVFGAANSDLTGDSFVAQFIFDPTQGSTYSSSTESYAFGGTGYGFPGPLVSVTLTINGVAQSITGDYASEIYADNFGSGANEQYSYGAEFINGSNNQIDNYLYAYAEDEPYLPASVYGPFDGAVSISSGYFDFEDYDISLGAYTSYADGYLAPTHLTISTIGAVPEPASWALMLAGFGAVGAVMRSRRQRVGVTYA